MVKILHITPKPPYPKIDGGCVAMATMFEQLMHVHETYLATISTKKHPFSKKDWSIGNLKKLIIHQELDTTPTISSGISSLFNYWSFWIMRFYNKSFEQKLVDFILDESITHVVLESLLLAPYILKIKALGVKVIIRTHNIEHELWQEKSKQAKGLKKIAFNMLHRKLLKNEVHTLNVCDGIIVISPNELNFAEKFAPKTPAIWIPLAIEIDEKSSFNTSTHFFHIGAMDWEPNIEGINWFLKEVWGSVHTSTQALMNIAGKGLTSNEFSDIAGVVNHGEVSSASDFMRNSGILVVPIFSGSGIRIKIIEAGKIGVPVIATPKAVEGLQLEAGVDYLAANTPKEFIEHMINLSNNKELQLKIGENLKTKIRMQFECTKLNEKLGEFIKNI